MAIAKVCGIETEYGILDRQSVLNPVAASSVLIQSYLAELSGDAAPIGWDFADEQPGADARGFRLDDGAVNPVETTLVNAVLTNGARYYVDHAHPEISTPECTTALDVVRYDRAAERIVQSSMAAAARRGLDLLCHKNNSDGKGNSYGCHENYLVDRAVPFQRLAALITAHFVTRQVIVGAGKVGCEIPGVDANAVDFQLSQRADFFEEELGLETTVKRPIVNTRDEPHCDPAKYRRLHVIVGDANMSEVATLLKVGTTALLLAMIEDDALGDDLILAAPVSAIRQVSHDPSLRQTVRLLDGRRITALELQTELHRRATRYAEQRGLDVLGEGCGQRVVAEWERALHGLATDPATVADTIDWVAKRQMVDGYTARHSLRADDPRRKAIDLQYHDLRPERCLAARAGLRTLVDQGDVATAMHQPPTDTRAWFRGRCLAKWPGQVSAANWDSVVFDVGEDPLRRVPMAEPLRGTKALTGALVDAAGSPAELLALLRGERQ